MIKTTPRDSTVEWTDVYFYLDIDSFILPEKESMVEDKNDNEIDLKNNVQMAKWTKKLLEELEMQIKIHLSAPDPPLDRIRKSNLEE